jgi:hypothetical protein
VGDNLSLVKQYSQQALVGVCAVLIIVFIIYIRQYRKKLFISKLHGSDTTAE